MPVREGRHVTGPRAVTRSARLLAAAMLLLALAGCTGTEAVALNRGNGDQQYVAGDGTIDHLPPAERAAPPPLAGRTLGGRRLDLADLRGHVVVLNVWGSWCAPCRAEAPALQRVYADLHGRGVDFVGIDTTDTDEAGRAFQRSFGITYPSIVDKDGQLLLAFRGQLNPRAIPTTLVLDRSGRVAARALKPVTESELRALIRPVLAESG